MTDKNTDKQKDRRDHAVRGEMPEEALRLAEGSDLSPRQAQELLRRHGKGSKEVKEAARNYKAES